MSYHQSRWLLSIDPALLAKGVGMDWMRIWTDLALPQDKVKSFASNGQILLATMV
jgi:hypothetical protein